MGHKAALDATVKLKSLSLQTSQTHKARQVFETSQLFYSAAVLTAGQSALPKRQRQQGPMAVTQQNALKLMAISFGTGVIVGWYMNRFARRRLRVWYRNAQNSM